MRKLKLLLAACALMGSTAASAGVTIETDLTSQFVGITAVSNWTRGDATPNNPGEATWAAPKVTVAGEQKALIENYHQIQSYKLKTGVVMSATVSGLANGTYTIELYGAACLTPDRGDLTTDFVEGDANSQSAAYLYATPGEGDPVKKYIPCLIETDMNNRGGQEAIPTVRLENIVVTDGTIEIGIYKEKGLTNWHFVQLKSVIATVDGETVLNNLKYQAEELLSSDVYKNVTGSERTNLEQKKDATPDEEADAYKKAIEELNAAILTFQNCDYKAYDNYVKEQSKAIELGVDEAEAKVAATDAADALAKTQALMVKEYKLVTTKYPNAVKLGAWTTQNGIDRSGQHWDGTATSTYQEQNEGFGSSSWSCEYKQDLTLPAGTYVFKVAGRKSSDDATITLDVKSYANDEDTEGKSIGSVNDFPNGATGKGIDTDGNTNFGEGTFANDGTGCGWQWRYVKFTLDKQQKVQVKIEANATAQSQWVSFCNATIQTDKENGTTAVKAINALTSGKAEIFNASGAQIPALKKGMNIIRTQDGKIQKVLVK